MVEKFKKANMPEHENIDRPDSVLVELIKQNDSLAFKELYYKYYNKLFRYAYYRVYSVETTKDLVQELFVRVWKNRGNLKSEKSLKAYLYRSLTNIIINHSNLESSQNISYSNLDNNTSSTQTDLDTKIDIQKAVNELPEKLKVVYLHSRVEKYKYAEIAEILGISIKAVEKRMSKALNLLRKKFI